MLLARFANRLRQLAGLPIDHGTMLGARPDPPDPRDFVRATQGIAPPDTLDLSDYGRAQPWNQGQTSACHDAATEVLTRHGWKLFSELSYEDCLASVDPESSRLIFEKPTRLISYHYDGELIYGKHNGIDFAVTPDHQMIVRPWNQPAGTLAKTYRRVSAGDLGWYSGLLQNVIQPDVKCDPHYVLKGVSHKHKPQRSDFQVAMDVWLKFLGIYLAEGTLLKPTCGTKDANKIQIAAVKEREKQFIRTVLAALGISALELADRFTFQNKRIYSALTDLGLRGVHAPHKFVPRFVFELPPAQIESFLLGHFMGDGGMCGANRVHHTSSLQLADDLQRLVFLAGGWATLSESPPRKGGKIRGRVVNGKYPKYTVVRWNKKTLSIDRKKHVSIRHYSGKVYCATVPTFHTLVTRRNRKILISGNCTGYSTAMMIETLFGRLNPGKLWDPSPLFLYYKAREFGGNAGQDSGAQLRDMMKVLQQVGVAPLELHPTLTDWKLAPSAAALETAALLRIKDYQRILVGADAPLEMMKTLHQEKLPLIVSIQLFENVNTGPVRYAGDIPLPAEGEKSLGGHALVVDGYDAGTRRFHGWNSWGARWGTNGRFSLPFEYFEDARLCWDIWSVTPSYW